MKNYSSTTLTNFLFFLLVAFSFNCHTENLKKISDFEIIGKDTIYWKVDKMPQYPGGEAKLLSFIYENKYQLKPEDDNGPNGRVIVRFVVRKTGEISDIEIMRSPAPFFSKDAIRIIKLLPKFTPGKLNGRKVNIYFTLPIIYRLNY
jgi:protein TonB